MKLLKERFFRKFLRKIDGALYWFSYFFIFPINRCLLIFLKNKEKRSIGFRVAHVSYLSTKPFIKTRVLRKLGIDADYIVPRGLSWLKVGEDGYDRYLGLERLPRALRPFKECYLFWRELRRYDIYHIFLSYFFFFFFFSRGK